MNNVDETLGEIAAEGYTTEAFDEIFYIGVDKVVEHEDGGATYTFDMNPAATQSMANYGLQLILVCAAYGVDIQDAFDSIRTLNKIEEDERDGAPT